MKVKWKKLSDEAIKPKKMTKGSSGFDLYVDLSSDDTKYFRLYPHESKLFNVGFAIQIPQGYEGQVRTRSGLASNQGLIVLNSPGTIDSDYTGPLKVLLYNSGMNPQTIQHGDRIAQIVFQQVLDVDFVEVDSFEETERSDGGFGSTGV